MTHYPDPILTEKEVQKISLGALRSYYRFRVKMGTPELISDVRGTGGIIADVQYSFPQEDGTRFMATLEATAVDSKEEVYYRRQEGLLLVDSLTFGSFITGLAFLIAHIKKIGLVIQYNTFTVLGIIFGSILILGAVFYLLLRNRRRYRYIYAIEQFKQYYANEQWIAISEDVFPDHRNRYFQELREQCIQYGFGLIQIDKERKPQLIITPARQDVFDNRRRRVRFYTLKQLERLQRGGAQFREQLKNILGSLPLPPQLQQIQMPQLPQIPKKFTKLPAPLNPKDPAYLFRFERSYQNQLVVMGFALAMVISVFWRELPQRPIRYVGQQQYAKEVIAAEAAHGPEPVFSMDLYDTIYIEPFDTTVIPYSEWIRLDYILENNYTQLAENKIFQSLRSDAHDLYDCNLFNDLQNPKYLVLEGVYPNFESASRRMSQLLLREVNVNLLWTRCFGARENEYIVYFDDLQNTLPEAQRVAKKYQEMLAGLQFEAKVMIRQLSRRSGVKIQTLNLR